MKIHCSPAATNIVLAAIALVVVLQAETAVMAQRMRSAGPSERERQLRDRELALRNLERERNRGTTDQQLRLPYEQINKDFKRMQIVNNDMMRAAHGSRALDYRSVSEATAEIKRCASRLKSNLVLPDIDKDEKRQKGRDATEAAQLIQALAALDQLIMSFVTNPVFKNAGVVDHQLSTKARRDLEDIIELSDRIKKNAEKLDKSSDKPR